MREIATTLTDYLLAVAGFGAALAFLYRPAAYRGKGPILFFTGFALAALFGGTWHGFFSAPGTLAERFLWWLSMLFMGMSAAGLAVTGIELLGLRTRPALLAAIGFFWIAFSAYIWYDPRFLPSLLATACGTLICFTGLARQTRRGAAVPAFVAMAGLGLSVVAGFVQQRGVAVHPVYFDHNATYHVLLLPALGLFYAGLRRIPL